MLRSTVLSSLALAGIGLLPFACGDNLNYYQTFEQADSTPDAGAPDDDGPPAITPDAGNQPEPVAEGAPLPDTSSQSLALDVFESVGAHYWFVVSDSQLEAMNRSFAGEEPGGGGDIYTPGGVGGETFVDHLLVTTPGDDPHTADFGKVQVRLVGQSTGRPWTRQSLPNFKIDSDEFNPGTRIGGVKHMRFNNAVIGNIFREKLTLDLYAKLGYPAPRATYAWVSNNVWGAETSVPYVLVESYKPQFCKQRESQLGGGCVNMWEFVGDLGALAFDLPDNCQFESCEATRANAFEAVVMATDNESPGFKAALAEWFDWPSFHDFQCLSWILGTGDDVLHNVGNNNVLVERADGKFQHLPYSVDISLGQEWYPTVALPAGSYMAVGCQNDPDCWADTITACDSLVTRFQAADPVGMLEAIHADLAASGMLRDGDQARYEVLTSYLEQRLTDLPIELDLNRDAPYHGNCGNGMIRCGTFCAYPDDCPLCEPEPQPDAGALGLADIALPGEPIPPPGTGAACRPPVDNYPGGPIEPLPFP